MHWLVTLPPRSIRSFDDLPTSFASQFVTNKMKRLKVVNLFDIQQNKGELLKSYLGWFNNATVRYPKEAKGQRMGANIQEWCEFHRAYDHSTEDCRTLLIQEGHLNQHVRRKNEKAPTSLEAARKTSKDELSREASDDGRREERKRERSRSPQRRDTRHGGVITTIPGGRASVVGTDGSRKRKDYNVLTVWRKANITPTPVITFSKRDIRCESPRQDEPMVISAVTV
ncbi:hypothetical protein CR513_29189, partial [Mucuna pruriens]